MSMAMWEWTRLSLSISTRMAAAALILFSVSAAYSQSVWFEPNRGQVAGQTEWVGRAKGAHLYITGNEVVYAHAKNLHMRLIGSSESTDVEGLQPTAGSSNYFTARDDKTCFKCL